MKKNILIILLIWSGFVYSQNYNYNLSQYYTRTVMQEITSTDTIIFTAVKPLLISDIENKTHKKDIFLDQKRMKIVEKLPFHKLLEMLFVDEFLKISKKNYTIKANLLGAYQWEKEISTKKTYWHNTRGFQIYGTLGENLAFYTDFFENQTYYPEYIDQKVNTTLVAPGQGVWKSFGKDKKGKDYNYATGYLSFSPNTMLNFQLGRSKHFIGSGYRSVLLSDNSAPYPFLKAEFTKGKIRYTILFTEFENFVTKYYFYHHKKHATFAFLNYSPLPNIEIGLFEAIMWRTSDDSTYTKQFPPLFFVPIPGIREIVYGMDNENNALLGLNLRAKIYKHAETYAQYALDNFAKENFKKRFAYQIGMKIYDVFAGKINNQNLFFQLEYNYAKPYTYTHKIPHQAFTNFNEPLINTLGSGFSELIGIINWDLYGFGLNFKYNNLISSKDTLNTNYGTNLLLSNNKSTFKNDKNTVGQGNKITVSTFSLSASYIVNPMTNLRIFIELNKRKYQNKEQRNELFFVSFGIKNTINNIYTDY